MHANLASEPSQKLAGNLQPEAHSLAKRLRREEGVEDAGNDSRTDPAHSSARYFHSVKLPLPSPPSSISYSKAAAVPLRRASLDEAVW